MATHTRPVPHRKRQGKHQKHTKHFLKTYWPYLPILVIVMVGLAINSQWQPRLAYSNGVLAYATDVSISGLLQATNVQRAGHGKASLGSNSLLNQAAQAKASDMATRDYWSHNTPEGNPPWVFIDQAGYDYVKAGENLAYGFLTSEATIAGWMNSPSHKANMLDSDYADVGFGIANAANYQGQGPATVVVAMYGKPAQVAAAPPANTNPTPPAPAATPSPAPTTAPVASTPAEPAKPEATPPQADETHAAEQNIPTTEEVTSLAAIPARKISRIQAITDGKAPWSLFAIGLFSGGSAAYLLLKHGLGLRKMIKRGERFIMKHAVFDLVIISLLVLSYILAQTAGTVL